MKRQPLIGGITIGGDFNRTSEEELLTDTDWPQSSLFLNYMALTSEPSVGPAWTARSHTFIRHFYIKLLTPN